MKNLLLTFVLLLTVSFAFAGNEVEETSIVEFEETTYIELVKVDLKTNIDIMSTNVISIEKNYIEDVGWYCRECVSLGYTTVCGPWVACDGPEQL